MPTLEEIVAEAVAAGRVRRVPEGARSLPPPPPPKGVNQRPESCSSGRQILAMPGADDMR